MDSFSPPALRKPSLRQRFLIEKSNQRRYLALAASARRAAADGWTVWVPCGTGWARIDHDALRVLA